MLSIAGWLKTRILALRGSRRSSRSLCGGPLPQGGESGQAGSAHTPQCGDAPVAPRPHSGDSPLERAVETLKALEASWIEAADAPHRGPLRPWRASPQELACLFLRGLQSHRSLMGVAIRGRWIQERYEDFCEGEGVTWPPPYKDFARELARIMTRRRIEEWHEGQRLGTATVYLVPVPATQVLDLAQEQRKRA